LPLGLPIQTFAVRKITLAAPARCRGERNPEGESLRKFRASVFVTLLLLAPAAALPQTQHITAREAKNHVGEKATVCGRVVGIHFVSSGKGQPTFVHFDEQYPNQVFTLVIWGSDRPKFGRPEDLYRNKDLCVTGKITSYLKVPEIVASNPNQVQIQK
jgi:hypothetical protein